MDGTHILATIFRRCFSGCRIMSRFSIVLPVSRGNRQPNPIQRFEDTLASVLRSRPRQAQVIVVHDGSYEDPHGLGSEIDWIVETSSNLASQFDLGVAASHGDLIVLIRPGVELDEGWESSLEEAFEDPQVGSLTPLIVPSFRPGRMTAAGVSTNAAGTRRLLGTQQPISNRSLQKLKPLGPSSHLAVYRRTVLSAIGRLGCLTDDVYLDVEVALSLRTLGFTNVLCRDTIATVESEEGILAESNRPHGCTAERSLYRYTRHGQSSTLARTLMDVAKSPLQPWRLSHGFQRLAAKRERLADQRFKQHLAVVKNTESWRETTVTKDAPRTTRRRAA